ncbi:hypothetical protein J3F84DRAFT_396645 [Trichoderma pleuroticola]
MTLEVAALEPIQLDVEDNESINPAFKFVKEQFGRLDILVNNAAWNKSWAVNTAGPHVVSSVFTTLLLKWADPRLIFIASGTATLLGQTKEDRFTDKAPAKGCPKEELGWTRVLKEDKVKMCAVSLGLPATGLGGDQELLRQMGGIDPRIGAELVRSVIEGEMMRIWA